MQSEVFISHSSRDKAIADTIRIQLESTGIRCWVAPRDIEIGADWTERIIAGIGACRVFVLVFSENANQSEHVRREVAKAFSIGLAVIPFRTEVVKPHPTLAYFLHTVHWLDAVAPPLSEHLNTLTDRVKQLLANEADSVSQEPKLTSETKDHPARFTSARRTRWIAGLVGATLIIAAIGWFSASRIQHVPRTTLSGSGVNTLPKSIAVLPFESISPNKEDSYFADGVQDEILNNLAKIAQLKVISRTSVMQYRAGNKRDLRQIASALGVASVLEGTVRREGNRIRVSTELVDAHNDNTVWADSYDRDLTDIFVIQSEVAQMIAQKLSATLSPVEKTEIEQRPTDNLEAYDLYLRAKQRLADAETALPDGMAKPIFEAIQFLEQAIRLDPKFALAYCEATDAHDRLYRSSDSTLERRTRGDAAITEALRLQPDLPEVHLAYATHLYTDYRDYQRARVHLAIAKKGLPNNALAIQIEAFMDRRQGRFDEAIQGLKKAISLDPRSAGQIEELAYTFIVTRQFRAAEEAFDRLLELAPDQPMLTLQKAGVTFLETGDDRAIYSAIAGLPASLTEDRGVLSVRLVFALIDRDWRQVDQLIEKMEGGEDDSGFAYGNVPVPLGCYSILLAALKGEPREKDPSLTETRQQLYQKVKTAPDDANLLSNLAVVDALLGRNAEAITEAKRAVDIVPVSADALNGTHMLLNLAVVYAWTNEPDDAFEQLNLLAKLPNGIYYGKLREPYWDPLRKDPRFDKLLAELASRD